MPARSICQHDCVAGKMSKRTSCCEEPAFGPQATRITCGFLHYLQTAGNAGASHWIDKGVRILHKDIDILKERVPLLQYLARLDWNGRPAGNRDEYVGLCPLHSESKPSFYVNTRKNVFYCHGCGCGGDVIRFVQMRNKLSFPQALLLLKQQESESKRSPQEALTETWHFYQRKFNCDTAGYSYLETRGVLDAALMRKMGIGFAPGGNLRHHLVQLDYPIDLLMRLGLLDKAGRDTFSHRIVFPCFDQNGLVNLYGRSLAGNPIHRFLPLPQGGLFAWNEIRRHQSVILVEGPLDLAVLWQAGFENATCSFGIHLSRLQLAQLGDSFERKVYIAFDSDNNGAGQSAARFLAQRLVHVGLKACIVHLPLGADPNSYFVAGATAGDFQRCLNLAENAL
jgi:DNA primase